MLAAAQGHSSIISALTEPWAHHGLPDVCCHMVISILHELMDSNGHCAQCVLASNFAWFYMSTLLLVVPPFCVELVVVVAFLSQTLLRAGGGL